MDGLVHLMEEAAASSASPRLLAILYAEDFGDLPPPSQAARLCDPTVEPALPALTQEDLDRACAAAVRNARAEWERSQDQLRTGLLAAMRTALAEARQAAERVALAAAEGTAVTMLSMLSGALPRLCRDHGPAEARALIERLLPSLRSETRITVRVHPDLAAGLKQDIAALEPELAGTVTILPASVEPGDLRVTWENGSITRDTGQILQSMRDALGLLGLQQPLETLPERRMALAD